MPQYIGVVPKLTKIVSLFLVDHEDFWASRVDLLLSNKIGCPTSTVRQQIKIL